MTLPYLLRRLGLAAVVLWAAWTVSFVVLYLLPGDPVATMASASDGEPVSPAELAALRARYGLDQPLPVQYVTKLWAALHGDLGTSFVSGQDVRTAVAEALPPTLQIAAAGLVVAVVAGTAVAVAATWVRSPWLRQVLASLPSLAVSLPVFWVGLMLVQLFSFSLGWLPSVGDRGPESLVLPAVTLGLPTGALVAQVLAKSLGQALDSPYVTTARAKGVGEAAVHLRHALGNAAIPALTVLGYVVGNVLAGSVVVETVFTRPGLGRLTVASVGAQDIPVVQGIVLFAALAFVVVNLLVDLAYPLLDPRVAVASGSSR
ncbi:Dipeptide transport system permease protein DppB [Pseudonocardia sp. Ae406_Ps2]|uniref:ABC transporter permease n=1 Tax=unclassified Pseudonocardia TaxID=2619320 RepID=UPI00094ACCCE|nr:MULTISPECIES: ABC transporter permease [unclassified Pseudonocardia]KAA1036060.1 ABC transporter permease [Pseudonocardia sp. EV170527-09]OLM01925.1 Dipeptide transport system permease protein DppB [Pseudonocardia sp. Ae406_Ps2]OLM06288.1 Dipeptide transport system permease protein DppB [Pseudonocardia sp. Ae331_Ps2]OLM13027.1 Dipeptide transport system permease protein DppB [Pseudonocardia sp. Ae505_Ps2]OLM23501.1 Dipeptide transport system permease protein DppB [Pseudonocardia sp. Ae706_P